MTTIGCEFNQSLQMSYPELEPLLQKVAAIRDDLNVRDIYTSVHELVGAAQTPSMAQSACSKIIVMSHPKAWGERVVGGGATFQSWMVFLQELAEMADACGQRVFEANRS